MKGTVLFLLCAIATAHADIDASRASNINDETDTGNSDPSQALSLCAALGSEGVLVAHENCNQFYKCSGGKPVALICPVNLLYNPSKKYCDWPRNVDCADRVIPENDDNDVGSPGNNGISNESEENEITGGDDSNTGNCDPSQAPTICASPNSEGVLVAHEYCNQFYKCSGGNPVALLCPGNLLFNPSKEYCDWPNQVDCGDRVIPEKDDGGDDNNNGGNGSGSGTGNNHCDPSQAPAICAAQGSDGVLVAHENCNQFYKCSEGLPVALKCPGNLLYNPNKEYCDWPNQVDCGDRVIPEKDDGGDDNNNGGNGGGSGTGNNHCDPSQAPAICAAQGSDGVLVAHENCNQFYKCSEGRPVALICPGNLLYNSTKEYCDWPNQVDCGDRVIPEKDDDDNNDGGNGDGSGTGNNHCDPSEAPAICAAENSEGVLIAHENCNQFYKCFESKPVALFCQLNLLYNPAKEYCDWPYNVNCGDRVVPGGDKTDEDEGGNAVVTSCSNSHDGNIVPHENCNQFYKCLSGNGYAMDCPAGLYYNTALKVCDWPMNVDCGNRLNAAQAFNKNGVARRALRLLVPLP